LTFWYTLPNNAPTYASRYAIVNRIFSLSHDSAASNDAEKAFYLEANRLLELIPDINSQLRTIVQPISRAQQYTHMGQLERTDSNHKNAINGIVSSFLAFGLMLTMFDRDPSWFILFALILILKIMPSLSSTSYISHENPSQLDNFVYRKDNLRDFGNTLHNTVSPYGLGQLALGLFGRASNVAITGAERLVERSEHATGIKPPKNLRRLEH
jgi:hypothetical protein